jgi:arylsulfatase A-like enzyme
MRLGRKLFNKGIRVGGGARVLAILLICGLTSCGSGGEDRVATEAPRKNLLFIMTDQQQYKALSIAGNPVLETPNLDRLARQGAYFTNAYTPCAVCAPARSSILTGHTVENTGMRTNDRAYFHEEEGLMTMPTFDEVLTEEGYHCEYYGKWHTQSSHAEIYRNPRQTAANGKSIFEHGGQNHVYMDYINALFPRRELQEGELYDIFTQRPYDTDPLDTYHGLDAEDIPAEVERIQPDLHGKLEIPADHSFTAYQAKETIAAIERLQDTTFSITCSFHFPHAPMLPVEPYYGMYPAAEMEPPASIDDDMLNSPYRYANGRQDYPEYRDPEKIRYMISNYYGLIRELDDWVGKILDKLDELELTEHTLIVFTSDHGEMLGAHGLREKNVFYEESAHIPLILRAPFGIDSGVVVDGYVSLVDLFPTILDYLDVPKQPSNGNSLRGLIEETPEGKHGKYVVTEWDYRGPVSPNYMVVADGWKLLIPYTEDSPVINALYNLNEDPHELNNLLGSNPDRADYRERAEELRAYLLEWLEKNESTHYDGVRDRVLL